MGSYTHFHFGDTPVRGWIGLLVGGVAIAACEPSPDLEQRAREAVIGLFSYSRADVFFGEIRQDTWNGAVCGEFQLGPLPFPDTWTDSLEARNAWAALQAGQSDTPFVFKYDTDGLSIYGSIIAPETGFPRGATLREVFGEIGCKN